MTNNKSESAVRESGAGELPQPEHEARIRDRIGPTEREPTPGRARAGRTRPPTLEVPETPLRMERKDLGEKEAPALITRRQDSEVVAFAGLALESLLAADLFRIREADRGTLNRSMAEACSAQWLAMTELLAAAPQEMEVMLIITSQSDGEAVTVSILAVGRGEDEEGATLECLDSLNSLEALLRVNVDHATFGVIEQQSELNRAIAATEAPFVLEVSRPCEMGNPRSEREAVLGFWRCDAEGLATSERAPVLHWPWAAGADSWHSLLRHLAGGERPASLVVRGRGLRRAPEKLRKEARARADMGARWFDSAGQPFDEAVVLATQARAVALDAPLLAVRVFLVSSAEPSGALVSTLERALTGDRPDHGPRVRRSCATRAVDADALHESLVDPSLDILLTPSEAAAVLRLPHPAEHDQPGLPVAHSRTAPMTGRTGGDLPLGRNVHQGRAADVALDLATRLRHVHVMGQTGTGKSTLLTHSILHDIRAGRGVAVIDPHGTLIDEVLQHFPAERADDLVIVDIGDVERPVGLNVLRIGATEPLAYRHERDMIIDELLSYCTRTFDRKTMGPMFESHLRGMLGLLLGSTPQTPPLIPSLILLRTLHASQSLRAALRSRLEDTDFILSEFLHEAESVSNSDHNIAGMSPYITSKFTRFISDAALRNVTCQTQMLDLQDLVRNNSVLLVNLAKGRIGDHAAGLVASQVVSRIWRALVGRKPGPAGMFALYVDECQLVVDERFAELLAEGRKFGLGITLAHQHVEQLPEKVLAAVLGNVGTVICLRVGARDAPMMAPIVRPVLADRDLLWLPNFQAAIRTCGTPGPLPFTVQLPTPLPEGDARLAERLRAMSRARYGRDRAEVEAEIKTTMEAYRALRPNRGHRDE